MTKTYKVTEGRPDPLGATLDDTGVNFAVFSENATKMTLCLFSDDGVEEKILIDLPEREGFIWHGHVAGIKAGQKYGYRAHGPYRPDEGHRFNPHKLLMDPYAKGLTGHPEWNPALMSYEVGTKRKDLTFSTTDSAPFMPRSIVVDTSFDWGDDRPPRTRRINSVIYEAHTKGLTALHPTAEPKGFFGGVASDPMLEYYNKLGITAVELLPVQAFINDDFLVEKGLTNYWGYQSIGFFAPDPRYMQNGDIAEFQGMVKRLHAAGIEVILDVVYNHTGEGGELGPTLCFKGLDNASYYRLAKDKRFYINDTGTGNTINMDHPMVVRMIMDSLRYWVEIMHVDGFRFDLCATLGRKAEGFDTNAAFFTAIKQDPVLKKVKLIAEPWDIGPGGYQLGAFPVPFQEWNDKFRDGIRRYWRGDPGRIPELAARLTGSAEQFDHSDRGATSSVNFVTAHDGYTLEDTVTYIHKHNHANGEDNNDGHGENYSSNFGIEGPSKDPAVLSARAQRKRNIMATLLLSQGTPMILAGDEFGNSQNGNNNAYCQDNELSWLDWTTMDEPFLEFTRHMIDFRKKHPILRQRRFLHSRERLTDGREDLFWRRADGNPMTQADWDDPQRMHIAVEMRTASGTPEYASAEYTIFMVFNTGSALSVVIPTLPTGRRWEKHIDTSVNITDPVPVAGPTIMVEPDSVTVLVSVLPE